MVRAITSEKILLGAFLLFVSSLPFVITLSNGLLLALLLLIIIRQIQTAEVNLGPPSTLILLFFGYYVVEIAGLVYSENLKDGFKMIERHIPLVALPIIFYYQRPSSELVFRILMTFIVSCVAGCLICIIVNINRSLEYGLFFHEWMFSHDQFSDPIQMQAVYFSIYVAFCLLVIIVYSISKIEEQHRFPNWLIVISIPILGISLILMGARTVTIITLGLTLLVLLYFAWLRRAWIFGAVALAVILVFSILVYLHPVLKNRFTDLITNESTTKYYDSYNSRFRIWKPGIEVIKKNFWLGVGTGDGQDALDKEYIKSNYTEGIGHHNIHNQYLQSLLNHGIIGLGFLLAIVSFQFWIALKGRSILYFCFLILTSFSMLTESVLNRNKGVLFIIFFSLLLSPNRNYSKS